MKTIEVSEFNAMVTEKKLSNAICFYLENEPYSKRKVGYVTYNETDGKVQRAVFGKSKLVAIDKFINRIY